jgi:hypothetical protein
MKNITPLCKIAYKYGTDKCPAIGHPYTPFYYELLKDKKDSIRKVIEIGIGTRTYVRNNPKPYATGASLYMWRDFFPNAQIYGVDILPESMFKADRIETYIYDETKKEDLENLIAKTGSDIDLFIDDGVHSKAAQIFLAKTVLPMLSKNIIYVIEDVGFPRTIKNTLSDYICREPKLDFQGQPRYAKQRLVIITNR